MANIEDYERDAQMQRRSLDAISKDIDDVDNAIEELQSRKVELIVEHDEVLSSSSPIPTIM